jgi:hypothetical protein
MAKHAEIQRMIDEPGNDLIVIPFHVHFPNFRTVPVRTENGFMFICRDLYNPDPNAPGSCIQ